MSKRRYEAVEAPTNTVEAIEASRAFWLRKFTTASLEKAIAELRCKQLGIDTSEVEINPEQKRRLNHHSKLHKGELSYA